MKSLAVCSCCMMTAIATGVELRNPGAGKSGFERLAMRKEHMARLFIVVSHIL